MQTPGYKVFLVSMTIIPCLWLCPKHYQLQYCVVWNTVLGVDRSVCVCTLGWSLMSLMMLSRMEDRVTIGSVLLRWIDL